MPYGTVTKVAAPIKVYDMIHAELAKHPADG